MMRRTTLVPLVLALLQGCVAGPAPSPSSPSSSAAGGERVIVLSIDSFNEERIRHTLPPTATQGIRALLDGAACAAARPSFPSLTSPGHAALWTGAYGDVNGVAGNVQSRLPRDTHALMETGSGFSAAALRAEPIWVTATLAGVRTAGHHATHSPAVPGFPPVRSGTPEPALDLMRTRAESATRSPALQLVNGYDVHVTDDQLLTHATHAPRTPGTWAGLASYTGADGTVAPREVAAAFGTGGDSLFVLFTGRAGAYTHALIGTSRDVARAAVVQPHAAEASPIAGRELARFFSEPFAVTVSGRSMRARARLFELARDGSRYMLFVPGMSVTAANHEATRLGYDAATGGWVGNSATWLLSRGAFGPQIADGGDGVAERRWLETAELATRTSIEGSRWIWKTHQPQLMLDYFAIGDDTDHQFLGQVSAAVPPFNPMRVRRVQQVRAHAWSLVDARIAAAHQMAREAGATVLLSGDHGMRAYWRLFRPNVALARAGLLAVDDSGRIVAARSRAMSPNGYWISVNRTAWRDGIVEPGEERAVIDSVVGVLTSVRGADGRPIVVRTYLASAHDSLGLGGPAGGDVYYELAEGYYYNTAATGPLTSDVPARGGHGFPSVAADMQTVVCAAGPRITAQRLGPARTIDLAPTVLELLGVTPAGTVRGASLLGEMR